MVEYFENPQTYVTLGTDSWTDVNGCSILNYVAIRSTKPILLASINTEQEGHTAQCLFRESSKIIDKFSNNIVGCCTDNANANKAMWAMLEENYPDKFAYGCNCHALHLLVKDLFSLPNAFKNNRADFPMHNFLNIIDSVTEIVKMFRRGKERQHMLALMKENSQLKQLSIMGETRWGSLYQMLNRFNLWLTTFFNFSTNQEWLQTGSPSVTRTKQIMADFVVNFESRKLLTQALKITEVINFYLLKSESDKYFISDVCNDWMNLISDLNGIQESLPGQQLPNDQYNFIIQAATNRWNFIRSKCHLIGYILDPRYHGEKLTRDELNDTRRFITTYRINPDRDTSGAIEIELNTYRGIRFVGSKSEFDVKSFWLWETNLLPL